MAEGFDKRHLAESLRDTQQPLERARTLPAPCYDAEAIHALEQEHLFPHHWLAVAREEDLPGAGHFVTRDIGRERILVVRGHDGCLRAFFNVCRHRGSRLLDVPSGCLQQAIVCPYHAWSYQLDGRLRRAPEMNAVERAEALALVAVPLARKDGFVFVHLDAAARPLEEALADLPDGSRFGLERLRRVRALEYRVEANWKLVCENYSECYHCPRAHPQLDRLSERSAGGFEQGRGFNGGPMQLRAGFDTLSTSGHSSWPRLDGASSRADDRLVHYYLVYPNLMLGIYPDYLSVHTVWPVSAAAARVSCEIFVPAGTLALAGFDPAPVIDFWDLTNRQDWALCERVQRGVTSRGYRPGPYAASERCVHAFDAWYAHWLASALAHA
jgi:Rieske 2Fe-2S family protein